jgi:hypothetical protein
MLYSIDDLGTPITVLPHQSDYNTWVSRITSQEYSDIISEIDRMVQGTEVQTAGWMPGNNWTGTVFEPIYTKSCRYNEEHSGLFFGLLVWDYFMNHNTDDWSFGRFENNGVPIRSITYFKINRNN